MPTEDEPTFWAVELEPGPSRVLLTWASASFGDYDLPDAAPLAYVIATSADSTDGTDGTWTDVVTVTDNPVRTRAHAFDFAEQSWVRVTVSAPATLVPVELDELAVFDVSAGAEDTWFFLGDSITAGAFQKSAGQLGNFEARVSTARPAFTPAVLGGGIGGEDAGDALLRLDQVLELNQDITYLGIGYGTNDSWGSWRLEQTSYEANMTALVDRILAAGHVPVIARIPYASKAHETLREFNAVVDRLTKEHGLPCGPDLYAHFEANEDELMNDGVHPTSFGYQSMNGEWAEAVLPLYPEP
jgi:lysophospholipase L1-like esterase